MAGERDDARGEIARRGLSRNATELVGRTVLASVPISMVDRVRAQLTRFFAPGAWTANDDAALAAIFGPGAGWTESRLDDELTLGFGWRANTFRLEARYTPSADPADGTGPAGRSAAPMEYSHTMGDTFESPMVLVSAPGSTTARMLTGPGTGGRGTFLRANTATISDTRVHAVFEAATEVTKLELGAGYVEASVADHDNWHDCLLALLDVVGEQFMPARVDAPDRQAERAQHEVGGLDPASARDLLKIVDALSSPDANYRALAVGLLQGADQFAADRGWKAALDDTSRAVRRAAVRAMSRAGREELRPLLERALRDPDACVRYYALRGLAVIGIIASNTEASRLLSDDDLRVRVAAHTAVMGEVPA